MRYFQELSVQEQEKVLDKLQDLPLFAEFRENTRNLLMTCRLYVFDDKLALHVLPGGGELDGVT